MSAYQLTMDILLLQALTLYMHVHAAICALVLTKKGWDCMCPDGSQLLSVSLHLIVSIDSKGRKSYLYVHKI